MTRVHVVVPARYQSERLPGKPLALIGNMPMIVRVMTRAQQMRCDSLVAAVDDERVYDVVTQAGFTAAMTRIDHESGSDRVMQVASDAGWEPKDIVINIQGDEPLFPPNEVQKLINHMLDDASVEMATLCEDLDLKDIDNPNVVKVVRNHQQDAMYFSRAGIPFDRDANRATNSMRHIGIYGFRVGALRTFTELDDSDLEKTERLEQLRWLEAGHPIRVLQVQEPVPGGVDTPEDLVSVNDHFNANL